MKEFSTPSGIYFRTNELLSDRQTLVFIHGLSGSTSAWFPYEKRWENSRNIVTIDLRGHGQSIKPKRYKDYALRKFG